MNVRNVILGKFKGTLTSAVAQNGFIYSNADSLGDLYCHTVLLQIANKGNAQMYLSKFYSYI